MNDMPLPNIATIRKYTNDFTLKVMAYRKLTDEEMLQALHNYMVKNQLQHIPKNKTLTIMSIHGAIDL